MDSLRADRIDSTSPDTTEERHLAPNIDQLASEGTNCLDAFATGPGTRQSFPGILSSTPPLAHGGYNRFGPDRPSLAERFRNAGFTTGAIHSNAQLSREFGYDRGFDAFHNLTSSTGSDGEGSRDTGIDSVINALRDRIGAWTGSRPRVHRTLKLIESRLSGVNRPYATATQTQKRASKWLTNQSGDAFAWVHFMDVHVPYYPPEKSRAETGCRDISNIEMVNLWQKLNTKPHAVTDEELEKLERLYDATVRYVDEEIGNLLETARRESDSEPIVAFTSDHGDEFRDHGGLTHSPKLYDELVHVPLSVTAPDRSPEVVRTPVSLMDIGPTLLSSVDGETDGMWGIDIHDQPDDRAVFSEVAQAPDDPNDDISRDTRVTACRTDRWTYIRDDLREREELYDRETDPAEQDPLSEGQIPTALQERVTAFRERVDDTSPELLARDMSDSVESRLEDLGYLNG